ncbi:hypothetical protein MG5_05819 [Candida albicans P57072]|nr:hypothetical protein MG5_05819 [Candida albicans P57072]
MIMIMMMIIIIIIIIIKYRLWIYQCHHLIVLIPYLH